MEYKSLKILQSILGKINASTQTEEAYAAIQTTSIEDVKKKLEIAEVKQTAQYVYLGICYEFIQKYYPKS